VTDVRPVHREHVKPPPLVIEPRDDEGAPHTLARQSTQRFDAYLFDGKPREETETPFTTLECPVRFATGNLGGGER
jgi:hypothetical protein